jgi:hypothetical protein
MKASIALGLMMAAALLGCSKNDKEGATATDNTVTGTPYDVSGAGGVGSGPTGTGGSAPADNPAAGVPGK